MFACNFKTILICSLVIVALASANEEKKKICEPGSKSQVECNTCTCSKDGTALACTRMACPQIPKEYLNADGTIKLPHENNPLLRNKRDMQAWLFGRRMQ